MFDGSHYFTTTVYLKLKPSKTEHCKINGANAARRINKVKTACPSQNFNFRIDSIPRGNGILILKVALKARNSFGGLGGLFTL